MARSILPSFGVAEAILIAAQSGRALAQAARRAGYRPFVADMFGDSDTLAMSEAHRPLPGRFGAGPAAGAVIAALDGLAVAAGDPVGVVLGSGFEASPRLIARIAARHRLVGVGARTVAALKDPFGFAVLCARLGVPHPAVSRGPVPDPDGWLLKRAGGSGGSHIRPATIRSAPPGDYLQRRAPGRAYALNVLADGRTIRVLALTEQWSDPGPRRPFRYGGALWRGSAEPAVLSEATVAAVLRGVERIAAATGLRGIASADFLAGEAGWWLTEINPRPGATLDILDRRASPLLSAHVAASLGAMPEIGPPPADAAAARICYAQAEHAPIPALAWPDHVRDRPRTGSRVRREAPLCTVLATGADGSAALHELDARTARLRAVLAQHDEASRGTPA